MFSTLFPGLGIQPGGLVLQQHTHALFPDYAQSTGEKFAKSLLSHWKGNQLHPPLPSLHPDLHISPCYFSDLQ